MSVTMAIPEILAIGVYTDAMLQQVLTQIEDPDNLSSNVLLAALESERRRIYRLQNGGSAPLTPDVESERPSTWSPWSPCSPASP